MNSTRFKINKQTNKQTNKNRQTKGKTNKNHTKMKQTKNKNKKQKQKTKQKKTNKQKQTDRKTSKNTTTILFEEFIFNITYKDKRIMKFCFLIMLAPFTIIHTNTKLILNLEADLKQDQVNHAEEQKNRP